MAAAPKTPDAGTPQIDLRAQLANVAFTPGRKHFPGLLDLLGDDDVEADVERALLRAGKASADFLASKYEEMRAPVRARVVRAMGRLARNEPSLVAWLIERLTDEDAKARRTAVQALGKVGDPDVVGVEAALLASWAREAEVHQRRSIAEALGKCGGASGLALLRSVETEDAELRRIVAAAVLRLTGRETRATEGAARASIREDASVDGLQVVFRCRRGLEETLIDELPPSWAARKHGTSEVHATPSGPLRGLFVSRVAMSFGFLLPRRQGGLAEAVASALLSTEAATVFERFSEGGVRHRIDWASGGKHRAAIFEAAQAVARARPDYVNDPSERNWEVLVEERIGGIEVELRPRLTDPRFTWRVRDVPAASHPTLAAALARIGGARPNDVVWDPFVGSGGELVERALLGPYRALHGTDREESALDASRANLAAASVTNVTLWLGDSLREGPPGVTLVVTNPPMGRRVLRHEDLAVFFDGFIQHAARVIVPGGRLVWVSPLPERTAERAARSGFGVRFRRAVDLGGFDGELQVMVRLDDAASAPLVTRR